MSTRNTSGRAVHELELIEAIKRGDEERARAIVSLSPELADTQAGEIPVIMLALYHGQRGIARGLVDQGATVDVFSAAALGNADRLAMLIAGNRAALNSWSSDGWTPLALASYFGQREAARLLIAAGADVQAVGKNETANTPLHAAVAGRRHELVELLIERGADVNALDGGSWTPLHLAVHEGQHATVAYLLTHGADPTIANAAGQTPLETAEREQHTEVATLLREHVRR